MKNTVLEMKSTVAVPIEAKDAVINVKLGWDAKNGPLKTKIKGVIEEMTMGVSDKSYDLNLAAVLMYGSEKKPELVFHGQRHESDKAGSVVLKKDNRTGLGGGSDESMKIRLDKIPEDVSRVILFMNIAGANQTNQNLYDVENVFVQVENAANCKVYFREEEAFKKEVAKDYCSYTFAELCREGQGWMLRGVCRYSREDNELDTLDALTSPNA